MNISIIKVKDKNAIQEVSLLAKKIWQEHYIDIIGQDQVSYMLDKFQSDEAIKTQIEKEGYIYYSIYDNDTLLGYFSIKYEEEAIFLSKYYIDITHRGKGIGRKVMNFIENLCKKSNKIKIYLTVNKKNSSVAIYQKLGYKIIKDVVSDIGNGYFMDDYMLEKII